MLKKHKKFFKYLWIVYAVLSIFIVLYLANSLICKEINKVSNRLVLDTGWKISVNDKVYENVSLDDFKVDSVIKGDIVVMETILPNDWDYKEAVLAIYNKHTAIRMYVNDSLEYEYGYDRYEENKATGSGYLLVNFFDEYKGKTLKVELMITEDYAFSAFEALWISEWDYSYRYILTESRLPMLVGSFLVVLGFMMTFILIFAVTISNKYRKILYLAIFSICIGLWTLCYYNVMIIFAIPLYSVSLMEYMSLFIAPIPILAYMRTYVEEIGGKIVYRIYKILFVTQFALTSITIMLHTLDIMHGAKVLYIFLAMFGIHMGFCTYVLNRNLKKNRYMQKITIAGMLLVVACVLYELANYFVMRYIGYNGFEIKGVSSVGLIIFIGILILDLYQRVTKSMMEEQERELLIKRAYTDELTKLYNRGYCSDYMKKVSDEKVDYTIVNFDLNGLKAANDTFGHVKGDELICHAAIVIDEAFSDCGVVGRMGGDEFIAIVENGDSSYIDRHIDTLKQLINEANVANESLGLSISYGYATSGEIAGSFEADGPEKVYQLADKRMYECKKKIKEALRKESMS